MQRTGVHALSIQLPMVHQKPLIMIIYIRIRICNQHNFFLHIYQLDLVYNSIHFRCTSQGTIPNVIIVFSVQFANFRIHGQ